MQNPWIKLWELANDDSVAHIQIDRGDADSVILVYKDGSLSSVRYYAGDWHYDHDHTVELMLP